MKIRLLKTFTVLIFFGVLSVSAQIQTIKPEPDKPIERQIKGGEAHEYQFKLKKGEFVRAEVAQKDIDVVVSLVAPDGKVVVEMDGNFNYLWRESVSTIANVGGIYKIQVRGKGTAVKSSVYSIKLAEQRKSTALDYKRIEAEQHLIQAIKLNQDSKDKESLPIYEKSVALWRKVGDKYWEAVTSWNLAYAYKFSNQPDKALELLNQILPVFREPQTRLEEAGVLSAIGVVYRDSNKFEIAKDYLEKSLAIRIEMKSKRREYNALAALLVVYYGLNQPDKIVETMNRMLEASRESKYRQNERDSLNFLGLYYFSSFDFKRAQPYFEQSLEIDKELKDSPGEITRLTNLAYIYGKLEQFEKVQKTFEQAFEIARETNDKNSESNILKELGSFHNLITGNFDKAREVLLNALEIKRELKNDKAGMLEILSLLSLSSQALGDYPGQIKYSTEGLEISNELNDKINQIDFLVSMAIGYQDTGETDKAKGYFEKAVQIARMEKLELKEALALSQFATFYNSSREFEKSKELEEQALLIAKKLNNSKLLNMILSNLGNIFTSLRQFDEGQKYYEQALEASKKSQDKKDESNNLQKLGLLFDEQSQFDKAQNYFEQAYKIAEETNSVTQQIYVLSSLGNSYGAQSEFEKTVKYYEKALDLAVNSKNISWQTSLNSSLGNVYLRMNQYEKAQIYFKQSIEKAQESKSYVYEAIALINLGDMYFKLNQYEKSRDYFEQVLKISQQTKNKWLLGFAAGGIGSVYSDLNDNQKARISMEQSLALMKDVADKNGEGNILNSLGVIYLNLKDYDKAQKYFEESLEIARATKTKRSEVYPLINLGEVFQNKNQFLKAQNFYERGLAASRELKDRGNEGFALNGLGVVSFKNKRYKEAENFYRLSFGIGKEVQSKKLEAVVLQNLMDLFKERKQPQLAIIYGKQAVNIFQEIRSNLKNFEIESRQGYVKDKEIAYRTLTDLLISEGRVSEARLILELLKEEEYSQLARGDEKKETVPYSQTETVVAAKIDNLIALEKERDDLLKLEMPTDGQDNRIEELQREINAANKALDNALKELAAAENSVSDRVKDFQDDINKNSLQSALTTLRQDTNSGIVALYTVLGKEDETNKKPDSKNEKTKFGWVIMVTEKSYKAYPIDITDFNDTVFQFQSALSSDKYDPQPLAGKLYNAIFRQKSAGQKRTLEQDLQEYLGNYKDKTIMWSLDGVLRYIPMAALHDGKNYLVEKYRSVIFTNNNFVSLEKENKADWKVLGLGVSEQRENFNALPGVKTELETIIREPNSQTGIINGTIKLNENFKKQMLFREISRGTYSVVHIASHYSFNPTQQTESFLLLGDGHLTFGEMEDNKNLFGAVDLLTLSACDTATSGNGKEAEGFAVKAQQLGAKSVIASLWKVSDTGTPELMIRFYKLRSEHPEMSKGEAFRQAQLSLLDDNYKDTKIKGDKINRAEIVGGKSGELKLPPFVKDAQNPFAHPHYWASFVLIGNWR